MWRVSYLNLKSDEIEVKNFKNDKEAMDWIDTNDENVIALKLLVWSEYLNCYREVEIFNK